MDAKRIRQKKIFSETKGDCVLWLPLSLTSPYPLPSLGGSGEGGSALLASRSFDLLIKPGAGEGPIPLGRRDGETHDFSRFFERQPDEEAEFD